jgi:hypothetical protein
MPVVEFIFQRIPGDLGQLLCTLGKLLQLSIGHPGVIRRQAAALVPVVLIWIVLVWIVLIWIVDEEIVHRRLGSNAVHILDARKAYFDQG